MVQPKLAKFLEPVSAKASAAQPLLELCPAAPRVSATEQKWQVLHRFVFVTVVVLSALYAAKDLKRGWFPWDDGVLAQSAESVLRGELPHTDYVEIYTGGLSYLNALSFRVFGTNLASMRYMLFLFFLLWVPAFYYAARRFVSVPAAGGVTLLAVAWSIPNYSAAMPSWYNLFFATFGLVALLRYIESHKARWLFAAGACGGISILFKISGLYFIAGALLFFLFRQAAMPAPKAATRAETALYRIFLTLSVVAYEALVFFVLQKVANAVTFLYFWAPNVAVGLLIVWFEFSRGAGRRFFPLIRELAVFAIGIVLPISIFLARYVLTGTFLQLFNGVSGSVGEHMEYVTSKPSVMKFALGISINLAFAVAIFLTSRIEKAVAILLFAGIPVVLFLASVHPYVDRTIWGTIWSFLPLIVVTGAALLAVWSGEGRMEPVEQQKLFLVLSICATTSLIQFPFTTASYYCYVVPFAFLSAAAVGGHLKAPPRWALTGAVCFCGLYIALLVTPGFVMNMGQQYRPDFQTTKLEIPRAGGIRIDSKYASIYEQLMPIIKEHSRGEYIFAIPNCPEVYFLSGLRDPTTSLLHVSYKPSEVSQVILGNLGEHGVNLIVLKNDQVVFGTTIPSDLRAALEREFPNHAPAGPFEVRWKS